MPSRTATPYRIDENPSDELIAKFWTKVALPDTNGCLRWTGALTRDGYGRISVGRRKLPAHRLAYTMLVGPIPDGLYLDHLCRVRDCVAPDHLEAVTNRENTVRGENFIARQVSTTHCPQGHLYDEANTYICGRGKRECRTCKRARAAKRRIAPAVETVAQTLDGPLRDHLLPDIELYERVREDLIRALRPLFTEYGDAA